jgi:hypothetical protein
MWIKFTADYPFSPDARRGHVTIAYKKDMILNATRECADKAIAAGAAVAMQKAKRDDDPVELPTSDSGQLKGERQIQLHSEVADVAIAAIPSTYD